MRWRLRQSSTLSTQSAQMSVGSRVSLFSLISRESHQTVNRSEVTLMLVGAAIAGLLIVSLFLEMISSSPKPGEEPPSRLGEPRT
jgi:hypothetical protein